MTTPNILPNPSGEYATADLALEILAEIDRITGKVCVSPGYPGLENYSAPHKTTSHCGLLLVRHPYGERNADDPDSISLAMVGWVNPDSSDSAYVIELNFERGLCVTRYTSPPSTQSHAAAIPSSPEGFTNSARSTRMSVAAEHDRTTERTLGLHFADRQETCELLEYLGQVPTA